MITRSIIVILVVFVVLFLTRFGFFFWKKKEEEKPAGTESTQTPKKEEKKKFDWKPWKKVYQIGGAVLSVIIICFVLKWFYPTEFAIVLKSNSFWFLVTLLVLNIALLEKTTAFVVFVRTIALIATIAMILVVGANFVKGGPQVLANARDFFVEPQYQKEIEKTRASHKDILASEIDKEVKQLQKTAQTRPLLPEELKKLDELEANLAKIYSKPEKEVRKKEGERVLAGYLWLEPGKIVDRTIDGQQMFCKVGEKEYFRQSYPPKKIHVISSTNNATLFTFKSPTYITGPAVRTGPSDSPGILRLMLDKQEKEGIMIYVKNLPR